MFRVAIGLLVVAIIAAIFGFGGIASTATGFAKIVFVVALVLAVVGFLMGGRGSGIVPALALGTTLALGGVAHAQEPGYGENGQVRSGVTFGGALGFGHIACDGADCDGVNEAGGIDVHVGGLVAPDLGIVLDLWGMSHNDDRATFSQAIVTGALRYWLVPRFWIQGGIGVAQATWTYDADVVQFEDQSETVPAVMGAIGLELLSTRSFAMDVQLRAGTGLYEDDVRVRNVSLGLGVNWY
jgi:uncharacterized membrane protein YtjA (UPF0391 family)